MSPKVTENINALPPLRDVIQKHSLSAQKSLGQNFLLDLNITKKIAREARIPAGAHAIEVGPGPGGLTRGLLTETSDDVTVTAIEQDRRFMDALEPLVRASDGRLTLVQGDALDIDVTTVTDAPRHIVANLPYNIATPLLIGWLEKGTAIISMTLMFQKEVADRIMAKPNSKAYGRLSVLCQWLCDIDIVMNLPPSAFTPPPKITSTVVRLEPKDMSSDNISIPTMERVTAAAFGQRRKMLRQSMKALNVNLDALFADTGIPPTLRAENLTVDEFVTIGKWVEKK